MREGTLEQAALVRKAIQKGGIEYLEDQNRSGVSFLIKNSTRDGTNVKCANPPHPPKK